MQFPSPGQAGPSDQPPKITDEQKQRWNEMIELLAGGAKQLYLKSQPYAIGERPPPADMTKYLDCAYGLLQEVLNPSRMMAWGGQIGQLAAPLGAFTGKPVEGLGIPSEAEIGEMLAGKK